MGQLNFFYGTMASGKTTLLLQSHYNLNAAFPGEVILLNKHDRSGNNVCTSRIGNAEVSVSIHDDESVIDVIRKHQDAHKMHVRHIFIDEVQFFLPRQVEELAVIADYHDADVHAFGLLTTYKGKLFEASKRLLELADESRQLNNEMRCWCGAKATHNALFLNDELSTEGSDIVVDRGSDIDYQVVCRKHFIEATNFKVLSKSGLDRKTAFVRSDNL